MKIIYRWNAYFDCLIYIPQCGAEKDVSFDHGEDGSIAEDNFFALVACSKGYTFNFVEGEMNELSAFSFYDLLRQRRRWLQGNLLAIYSNAIPRKFKVLLSMHYHAWVLLPISVCNFLIFPMYSFPDLFYVDIAIVFTRSIHCYAFIFGVLKSYPLEKLGAFQYILWILAPVLLFPIYIFFMCLVALYSMVTKKVDFYVVQKDCLEVKNVKQK